MLVRLFLVVLQSGTERQKLLLVPRNDNDFISMCKRLKFLENIGKL